MKSSKIFFTLLFFLIAVVFIGCPAPIGSILYAVDYIKVVPSKTLYGKNDVYIPAKDVKVIGVFGGAEDEIPIDKVKIKTIFDPGFSNEKEEPVPDNKEGRVLEFEGPYTVVITYNNLEARYNIAVGEPGMGDGGWGDTSEGTGIKYIWPDGQ